mmetsp:Transcript_33561/g.107910  ORF Transcript_33561/g.107910 Transcript_33561/m.107910 type:complete len:209 (-) Transcript_33561:215-841(-)
MPSPSVLERSTCGFRRRAACRSRSCSALRSGARPLCCGSWRATPCGRGTTARGCRRSSCAPSPCRSPRWRRCVTYRCSRAWGYCRTCSSRRSTGSRTTRASTAPTTRCTTSTQQSSPPWCCTTARSSTTSSCRSRRRSAASCTSQCSAGSACTARRSPTWAGTSSCRIRCSRTHPTHAARGCSLRSPTRSTLWRITTFITCRRRTTLG